MANDPINDISGVISGLVDTASKLAQQQIELFTSGVTAVVQLVEPLGKTAIDLVGSAANTAGQLVQNVTSAIAPKK